VTVRGSGRVGRRGGGARFTMMLVLLESVVAVLGFAAGVRVTTAVAARPGASWFAPSAAPAAAGTAGTAAQLAGEAPDPGPAPTRVRIPAIGVDAPLETLHLDGSGALAAPRRFAEAGWYADGTPPGEVGPAVIAGHIDSTRGPAVFYRLDRLRPGDLVEVARGGHWLGFRVVATGRYAKQAFPTAAVYGPTPDPQLRLITCGGAFDRTHRSYVDNTVVYAVAA
jgi:LPXTG-site transpeptidase (sortase) family protein